MHPLVSFIINLVNYNLCFFIPANYTFLIISHVKGTGRPGAARVVQRDEPKKESKKEVIAKKETQP